MTDDTIQELLKQESEYVVQSTQSHSQSEDQSEVNGQRIGRNPDPNPIINNSDYYCKKIQNWLSVTDVK